MTSILVYHHLCLLASVLLIATKSSGESNDLQRKRRHDVFGDNKDFFGDSLDEMDENTRMQEKLDEGFDIWEDRCLKVGGQKALDRWLEAQEKLIFCVMEHFNVAEIQNEVEEKKATGDLDIVFKKYCSGPVRRTRPCLQEFLHVSSRCLKHEDRGGLNATLAMVDAAVGFVCYNSGDRIALFMAEKGVECLIKRKESIVSCINRTIPELFATVSNDVADSSPFGAKRRSVDPVLVFDRQNCQRGFQLRSCVENELLECDDPTPSNVVNALLLAVWNTTPCERMGTNRPYTSLLSGSPQSFVSLPRMLFSLPSLVLLVALLLT